VERCEIVLMSAEGVNNREQARRLSVDYQRVRRWRQRWAAAYPGLNEAEEAGASAKDLTKLILDALADEKRPGTPSKFSAEQLAQILSVACESPEDCGRPVTHWTPTELALEVVKRKIVEDISPRHLDRFLKGGHPAA
ncbi:MAG: helix-turn-helix domain-containing protein, partial [Symploca sp. SIO2E9]|nr:helix-turn-helix domain-containing protein [Symploca sp. SIO2E9]